MGKKDIHQLDLDQLAHLFHVATDSQAESDARDPRSEPAASDKTPEKPEALTLTQSLHAPIEHVGSWVGPFRLVSVLGEGGMGIVYLADQTVPIRRRVALKVIKPGMDSARIVARFEAERQALALLDHPNIAQVHSAGTTDNGRPYFVMEYVKGLPITAYCDHHKLAIEERLRLFQKVCQAVQHAHQKGIIHRDIKPSNILVSTENDQSAPKIIDFGVAKAISQPLTERTLFTEDSQLIGTPEYMSPEQADMANEDIDTRSDVYSLGVLLYELVTGILPFDTATLREGGLDHLRQVIRETDPKTPSTRLTKLGAEAKKVAESRCTEVTTLAKRLRRELEWIPLKAMRKDRAERYRSVSELADDIDNYLAGAPLIAGPLTTVYRLRKLVRRNRVLVIGIAALIAVLAAGVAVSTLFALQARRQARISEAYGRFLRDDLLTSVSPSRRKGRDVTIRSFLDTASENLDNRFKNEPLVEAPLRATIGGTYRMLGEFEAAEPHLERAFQIYQEQLGAEDPKTLSSLEDLAWLRLDKGRHTEAAELLEKGLSTARRALGPDTLRFVNALGCAYKDLGRYDEAEQLFLKSIAMARRVHGDKSGTTLMMVGNLGQVYEAKGDFGQAERQYREVLDMRNWGDENIWTLLHKSFLARVYMKQNRYDEAETLYREVLPIQRRIDGDRQLRTLWSVSGLAQVCTHQGKYDEANDLFIEALTGLQSIRGNEHQETVGCMNGLAELYVKQELYDKAEPLLETVLEINQRKLGPNHARTIDSLKQLVNLYESWNKPEEAAQYRSKLPKEEETASVD